MLTQRETFLGCAVAAAASMGAVLGMAALTARKGSDAAPTDGSAEEVEQLRREVEQLREMRQAERKGRIKAQQQLRELIAKKSASNFDNLVASSLVQIGEVQSPFQDRRGTPRQSGIVQSVRGKIAIRGDFQPQCTLAGLQEYSHLWVLFIFDRNTNNNTANVGNDKGKRMRCKAKVTPPRLGGKKVGCLACRTPHRPSNIGLSLVKIERVLSDGIEISGHDLVDGTPVIDVKPFVPYADGQQVQAVSPDWVATDSSLRFDTVEWTHEAQEALEQRQSLSFFYLDNPQQLKEALDALLSRDMRSMHRRQTATDEVFELRYDAFIVKYHVHESMVTVVGVDTNAEALKQRKN